MNNKQLRQNKWFGFAYKAGIFIKGFDGFVELLAGFALLFAPGLVHSVLSSVISFTGQHHVHHFIADYIARLDDDLARSGLTFLIIFLISHGAVKVVLVYCLLKEIVKAYPYAIAVLGVFLVYQLYVLVQDPLSIGMWLFTILDVVIIWLVWGEYKELREKTATIRVE